MTAFVVASFVPMALLLLATAAIRLPASFWGSFISFLFAGMLFLGAGFLGYLEVSGKVQGWLLVPVSFALTWFTFLGIAILVLSVSEIQERRREERYLRRKEVERRVRRALDARRSVPLTEEEVSQGIDWDELEGWLSRH